MSLAADSRDTKIDDEQSQRQRDLRRAADEQYLAAETAGIVFDISFKLTYQAFVLVAIR